MQAALKKTPLESRKRNRRLLMRSKTIITISLLVLLAFGTVMVLSTKSTSTLSAQSTMEALRLMLSTSIKQAAFAIGAFLIYVFAMKFFKPKMLKNSWGLYSVVAVYLLILAMTAGIGTEINGSKAWISLGGFSLQPSEFGKPLTIAVFARAYMDHPDDAAHANEKIRDVLAAPLIFTAANAIFLGFQKDIGSLVISLGIALVCVLVPADKRLHKLQRVLVFGIAIGFLVGLVTVYMTDIAETVLAQFSFTSHVATRIANMKNPYNDILDSGYQPANALYGIADAGFFGKGLGSSIRKYGFLTQAESDYILAIVIEETGILGLSVITISYLAIMWALARQAQLVSKTSVKMILVATASYFMLHFIVNIGGVSGLIPMTGVPLLLISSGGSSMLAVCIALGMSQGCIEAGLQRSLSFASIASGIAYARQKRKAEKRARKGGAKKSVKK
jgi:cell division protein FtsW